MKEDEINKFVNEHREAFDDRKPPADLWDAIAMELPEGNSASKALSMDHESAQPEAKRRRMFPTKWLSIAAGLLLLIGAVGMAYQQGVKSGAQISAVQVNPEFSEIERHYEQTIQKKVAVLVSVHQDENILKDLNEMSVFMDELKIELQEVPVEDREVVVAAMIENYQARLSLLNRIFDRLQNSNLQSNKFNNSNNATKEI